VSSQEAKEILLLYRLGIDPASEEPIAAALEQTRSDPELRQWFEQHCAWQSSLREKFQQVPVPADLKERILSGNRNVIVPLRPAWRRTPVWLAAAATVLLWLGLAIFLLQPHARDRFTDYRSRIVRAALRQYEMDIVTNDLQEVRRVLARQGAPSDFVLSGELGKLAVTGGARMEWRGNPVSMVCFDRGDKQILFLFVVARSAIKDTPTATSAVGKVNKLLTTSWTKDDKTYLLAGPEDTRLLQRSHRGPN
jgi:hypothetical protein